MASMSSQILSTQENDVMQRAEIAHARIHQTRQRLMQIFNAIPSLPGGLLLAERKEMVEEGSLGHSLP